jgi:hypothetical protein
MKLWTSRRFGVLALVVVGVGMGGIAYASIPDSSGLISGCYQKNNGNLRVIDSSGKGCGTSEKPLNWSQTGPSGTDGTNGTNGVSGYELVKHEELYQAPFGSDPVAVHSVAHCPSGKFATGGGGDVSFFLSNGAFIGRGPVLALLPDVTNDTVLAAVGWETRPVLPGLAGATLMKVSAYVVCITAN